MGSVSDTDKSCYIDYGTLLLKGQETSNIKTLSTPSIFISPIWISACKSDVERQGITWHSTFCCLSLEHLPLQRHFSGSFPPQRFGRDVMHLGGHCCQHSPLPSILPFRGNFWRSAECNLRRKQGLKELPVKIFCKQSMTWLPQRLWSTDSSSPCSYHLSFLHPEQYKWIPAIHSKGRRGWDSSLIGVCPSWHFLWLWGMNVWCSLWLSYRKKLILPFRL